MAYSKPSRGGRVLIYVVGFEERYWGEHGFGTKAETVDVRRWLPRDVGAVKSMKSLGLVDYVLSQPNFSDAVLGVIRTCIDNGRCICGSHYKLLPKHCWQFHKPRPPSVQTFRVVDKIGLMDPQTDIHA